METNWQLERKFSRFDEALTVRDGSVIEGYASLFGDQDRGGDIVERGAYARSLMQLQREGWRVKLLWQHDPAQPIGVWEEVREDDRGLFVKGRLLDGVNRAREAAVLIAAGAIDGLSIGFRTLKATKQNGRRRLLQELELWEVSLVTFPMLPKARVGAKTDIPTDRDLREMAAAFEGARREMALLD